MAVGRILKNQISVSEQVNDLSIKSALLFTWLIPHLDDFGRISGNTRKIKAIVVPMREDINSEDVQSCLHELQAANLIIRYAKDDKEYIQVPNFDEHQSGLHKRTKSKFPSPDEPGVYALNEEDANAAVVSRKFPEILGSRVRAETETELETELEYNKKPLAKANVKKVRRSKNPECPYDKIFDLYEKILVDEPKADPGFNRPIAVHINARNDERKKLLFKRWQESIAHQDLKFWEAFFWVVRETPLYNGSITNSEYPTAFKPDIEWMIKRKFSRIVDKLPRRDEILRSPDLFNAGEN